MQTRLLVFKTNNFDIKSNGKKKRTSVYLSFYKLK